jgi:hypothetical protein
MLVDRSSWCSATVTTTSWLDRRRLDVAKRTNAAVFGVTAEARAIIF